MQSSISYSDFINTELFLFSIMDNERSIPSVVDGESLTNHTPRSEVTGQRKVTTTITLTPSLSIGTYSQCSALGLDASSYHLMRTSWCSRRMIIYVLSQSGIVLSYLLFWSMVVRVLVLDPPLLYLTIIHER